MLTRPFLLALRPDVTPEKVSAILAELAYAAEVVRVVPKLQTWSRDPKDAPYLDMAIAAEADFLVTRDADLLHAASDHSIEGKQFRQKTRNRVQIVDPLQFLDTIA